MINMAMLHLKMAALVTRAVAEIFHQRFSDVFEDSFWRFLWEAVRGEGPARLLQEARISDIT